MNDYATAAKFLAEDGMRTLPIACRLVPLDQWLVTHVDTSWKIKDIKQWILSKCNLWEDTSGAPQPPRFRPASPVTFSAPSRRSSLDSGSWGGTEEGAEDDDWDAFAAVDYNAELRASESGLTFDTAKSSLANAASEHTVSTTSFYTPPPPTQRTSTERDFAAMSAQYTLVSFSNGFILEDDADLSWYRPRPFELIEVHRAGGIVSLPRVGIAYAEPYFESPVRVSERPHGKRPTRSSEDQQAHSAEWKARWAIVRDGILHLCKEAHSPPTHRFPISALNTLSSPEHCGLVVGDKASMTRVICAKFNRVSLSGSGVTGESDEMASPGTQRKRKPKTSSWVILDLQTRSSYENLLRVLHRLAPHPLPSTFLPPRTPASSPVIASSPRQRTSSSDALSSPILEHGLAPPISAFFGVQYPEWRLALVQRCRAAGRGAIGSALALAQANCLLASNGYCEMYHPLPRAPSISEGLRRCAEQTSMGSEDEGVGRESDSSGPHPWKAALSEDDDEEGDDDVESEVEWEGWIRDLARRPTRPPPLISTVSSGHKSISPGRSRAVSPSSPSSSEADYDYAESGGTARVRTFSYAPPLRSTSSHRARSNTISAAGTALGETYTYTSTTTTTITTYVDRVPDLLAPSPSSAATWTHHSYEGPVQPLPSPTSSPRNTPRARRVRAPSGSATGGTQYGLTPPQSISGPGSRAASVSGSELSTSVGDVGSGSGRNGGIGGVKRIVRGVSIRNAFSTERFVRGLEDALDFVDGR
ncbi:uncharacterized protein FOMMEDRAFT_134581 [Fomitiporia mediterranea MF3/22]|uniref:uncharacterized protein n=1 Tax=Fomitiporia mediterranea (strain MF3/22) TaxID=694068 RepID=UPI0004409A04|nr:uncharacterized protein FOMMEDRAFT_134581 [Fomitiporia mediterranea MF3/22]EJD01944.1 hypothetical protein FOMMEDRAFT_134581 [Fomitiporia mediterranea MF3/22]